MANHPLGNDRSAERCLVVCNNCSVCGICGRRDKMIGAVADVLAKRSCNKILLKHGRREVPNSGMGGGAHHMSALDFSKKLPSLWPIFDDTWDHFAMLRIWRCGSQMNQSS